MILGYYPGCSQKGSALEFEMSLLKVAEALGISLKEIEDWSCCGATSAHVTNHRLSNALAMRNVMLAEQQGLENMVAPCAACYNRLMTAKSEFGNRSYVRADVENILSSHIKNEAGVFNVLELLLNAGIDNIVKNRKRDLEALRVACYYGCLLVRPAAITGFDDCEQPSSMEKLVEATGAKSVDWNSRIECCGAAHSIARRDIVVELSKKILEDAKRHGANVIAVACPMCHTNLDMRQRVMKRLYSNHEELPVLYITELIGLSFGMSEAELGIDLHYTQFRYNDILSNIKAA